MQDTAPPDPGRRAIVLPVVGYSERTGTQLGVTAFRGIAPADGGSRAGSDAIYIARTNQEYTKAYVQSERWSGTDDRRIRLRLAYQSYPLPYFGIGPRAPESAEEWFSMGTGTAHLLVEQRVAGANYVHLGWKVTRTSLRQQEPDGAIANGLVPYSSGTRVSALVAGLVHDGRDHPGQPHHGTYVRALVSGAGQVTGSSLASRRFTIDARQYATLGDHRLAMQVQFDAVRGDVPFDQLPMLGADSAMRGYPVGRFRDRQAATMQVELRTGYWRKVGFVGFVGAGTVSPRLGDFANVPWHPTVGIGGRYLFNASNRLVLRADLGFGRGSWGANFGIGEAF